jgi:hypothetical protein
MITAFMNSIVHYSSLNGELAPSRQYAPIAGLIHATITPLGKEHRTRAQKREMMLRGGVPAKNDRPAFSEIWPVLKCTFRRNV